MRIKDLVQTCGACPSQWSAKTEEGNDVYIRYRWGCLTMDIDGELIQEIDHGDGMDGFMTEREMLYLLDLSVKPED